MKERKRECLLYCAAAVPDRCAISVRRECAYRHCCKLRAFGAVLCVALHCCLVGENQGRDGSEGESGDAALTATEQSRARLGRRGRGRRRGSDTRLREGTVYGTGTGGARRCRACC